MGYVREEIRGNSPQDTMKINENFMSIFEKVFGDINFSDVDTSMQNKINTQWLPVQGEGNFDSNYPLYIRFFVSPNVKQLKSSSFNFMAERYRMDSGVTEGGGETISEETTSNSGEITSRDGGTWTSQISSVNNDMSGVQSDPMTTIQQGSGDNHYHQLSKNYFLHNHMIDIDIPSHTHIIPPHNHAITVSVPKHTHKLTEGIRVSNEEPKDVSIYLNDNKIATIDSTNILNNLDLTENIRIGEWNTLKITTSNLARIVVYGTIETLVR